MDKNKRWVILGVSKGENGDDRERINVQIFTKDVRKGCIPGDILN